MSTPTAKKTSRLLGWLRPMIFLARLIQNMILPSMALREFSRISQASRCSEFLNRKSLSSFFLPAEDKHFFSSTLRASSSRNWFRLSSLFSSFSQGCLKKSSKDIRSVGSQTIVFLSKSAASCETVLGILSSDLMAFLISALVIRSLVKKGFLPTSSWYSTIPRLHKSHFSLQERFSKISGAMVRGVPTQERKNSSSSSNLANPKSAILISKSSVTKMLASFRSRCTTLFALMVWKACLI